jgi:hypothetical protein
MIDSLLRLLFSPNEWLVALSNLTVVQLIGGVAVTAALVAVLVDWRLGLLVQVLQYLLVGLLLTRETWPQLAMVKVLVGGLACFVLYWTGRAIEHHLRQQGMPAGQTRLLQHDEANTSFRVIAMTVWSLALIALMDRFGLGDLSRPMNSAAYWLIGMGLLTIILTREPFRTGLGLLTISNGVEMVYLLYEPSLMVLGLLGIATILTALVAAYLTVVRHVSLLAPPLDPSSSEALAQAVEALAGTPRPRDKAEVVPSDVPEEALTL